MSLSQQTTRAAARYGPSVNTLARRRYGISGRQLLARLVQGESGDRMGAVSSAGARGKAQFTAGSRSVAVQKYGIDPWRSTDEAVHAAALHLRGKINGSKGLEGYNPGSASYPKYILGQRVGKIRGPGGGQNTVGIPGASPSVAVPELPASANLSGLLASLTGQRPQVQSSGPAAPAFSAHPLLPGGYQAPSGGGPSPEPSVDDALKALQTTERVGLTPTTTGGGTTTTGAAPSGGRGRVRVAPGADRAGVHTHKAVIQFAREVSGIAGTPVRIGTGTNHSRMTVDGNVSDHWSGNAADIPATGRRLIRLGQAALIAAGMPRKQARKQHGGLYNVGGHQVIFNTHQGGDHTNHLHVSAR